MGWVSQRHMNTSGGLNPNPRNNGSQKGPLRKRVQFIAETGSGMMKREKWLLECGHEAWGAYGSVRSRCGKCKQSNTGLQADVACTCAHKKDGSVMVYSKTCPDPSHAGKAIR